MEEKINQIILILSNIEKSLDQILSRSIRSNHNQSDQIRSDLISNIRAKDPDNWKDLFISTLESFQIDYEHLDLDSIETGIKYFLSNQSGIRSQKSYIKKILAMAGKAKNRPKDQENMPTKTAAKKPKHDDTSIMGVDRDIVESKAGMFSLPVYTALVEKLPAEETAWLKSYRETLESRLKLNIATALAIKYELL